jgi:valyl-tRNA synthetase
METGYDILFFWVARMIMSGLEFTGQAPFHTVYLHGLIRDEIGRKMSKTYGNVIDPLVVMDDLGTDALRFTLLVGSTPGNDANLSIKKVEANRNFANKIWNAGRFVISSIADLTGSPGEPVEPAEERVTRLTAENAASISPEDQWTLADSWVWARTMTLVRDVERLFQGFQYGEAGRQIYEFFWSEFADWYVEVSKLQMAQGGRRAVITAQTLVRVLDTCLRLLHPFTPFITEELWGYLKQAVQEHPLAETLTPPGGWAEALMLASWPQPRPEEGWEAGKTADFNLIQELVRAVRNLRSEKNVRPGQRIPAIFAAGKFAPVLRNQATTLTALAGLDANACQITETLATKPEGHIALVVGAVEIYLPLAGLVDIAEERARLQKDLAGLHPQIERLEALLAGPFAQKAPAAVVQKEHDKLAGYREAAEKIRNQLESL